MQVDEARRNVGVVDVDDPVGCWQLGARREDGFDPIAFDHDGPAGNTIGEDDSSALEDKCCSHDTSALGVTSPVFQLRMAPASSPAPTRR